jgi:hypothetical protein
LIESRDWQAWYNRMPGADDRDLHVSGVCVLESSSFTVRLEPGNESVVDDPAVFVLELIEERPQVGDDRVTEKVVEGHGPAGDGISEVQVRGAVEAAVAVSEAR